MAACGARVGGPAVEGSQGRPGRCPGNVLRQYDAAAVGSLRQGRPRSLGGGDGGCGGLGRGDGPCPVKGAGLQGTDKAVLHREGRRLSESKKALDTVTGGTRGRRQVLHDPFG